MKFVKMSILMMMIISLIAISPAIAGDTTTIAVDSIGDHSDNNYQSSLAITADHGGSVDLSDNSHDGYTDASVTNVFEAVKLPARYTGIDAPIVTSYIASVYEGQVMTILNDKDEKIVSKPGDKYEYYVRASVPVLAYVVNVKDIDKAKWDINCAPKYDPYTDKFELGNLDKIYVNEYRSPQQRFEVTIPADGEGRYALVIDTRVAHSMNGQTVHVSDDSVDVVYNMQKISSGVPQDSIDFEPANGYIGNIDIFPTSVDGTIIT